MKEALWIFCDILVGDYASADFNGSQLNNSCT